MGDRAATLCLGTLFSEHSGQLNICHQVGVTKTMSRTNCGRYLVVCTVGNCQHVFIFSLRKNGSFACRVGFKLSLSGPSFLSGLVHRGRLLFLTQTLRLSSPAAQSAPRLECGRRGKESPQLEVKRPIIRPWLPLPALPPLCSLNPRTL